jgi:DeoR family deoxyribose operon repressor
MQPKIERLKQVVSILRERNGAAIKDLAGSLGVSEMTIRRDLERLRLDNIISLVHGAAIYNSSSSSSGPDADYHVAIEEAVSNPEKERIGKAAARMVSPGDTIIIDIGTTTEKHGRGAEKDLSASFRVVSVLSVVCLRKAATPGGRGCWAALCSG